MRVSENRNSSASIKYLTFLNQSAEALAEFELFRSSFS